MLSVQAKRRILKVIWCALRFSFSNFSRPGLTIQPSPRQDRPRSNDNVQNNFLRRRSAVLLQPELDLRGWCRVYEIPFPMSECRKLFVRRLSILLKSLDTRRSWKLGSRSKPDRMWNFASRHRQPKRTSHRVALTKLSSSGLPANPSRRI